MKRISRYYPGCDGTKLAVDLYFPENTGGEKIPVVFHTGNDPRRMRYEHMEAGVRAQLYCNGLRFFGNEPEIKKAVVEFLTSRV